MKTLGPNCKIGTVLDYASGTADRDDGEILDMAHWTGVLFLLKFATIASSAVTKVTVEQAAALTDPSTLTNPEELDFDLDVADDDDDELFWIDLVPTKRYVQLKIDKNDANASAETVLYMQYGRDGRPRPVADDNGDVYFQPGVAAD